MKLNIKANKNKKYPAINLKTREFLKNFFKPYNVKLQELTEINIDTWN